jgi:hypothetical protein
MRAVGVTASLDGGGGDDVLSVSGDYGYLSGDDGDDTLIGGDYDDVLNPGRGRDVVEGNGGIDDVHAVDAPASALRGVRVELGRTMASRASRT